MDGNLKKIAIDLIMNWLYGFMFFIVGILIGLLLGLVIYKINLKITKNIKIKRARAVDVSKITEEAIFKFQNADTKLNINKKIELLIGNFNYIFEQVSNRYYFADIKKHTIFENLHALHGGITINCSFTIIELLAFCKRLTCDTEDTVNRALASKESNKIYKAYRIFNRQAPENIMNAKISLVYNLFFLKQEIPPNSAPSKLKTLLSSTTKSISKPIIKLGISYIEPSVIAFLDNFVIEWIDVLIEDINLLYSHNFVPIEVSQCK